MAIANGERPPNSPAVGARGRVGVARGLTRAEAERWLRRYGPNLLPVERGTSAWRHFLGQLVHFFAIMLWVAGALAFMAGLPELGVAIFAVVVVNAVFAFAQEYRAERAAERLRELLPQRVTVVRDGAHLDIDAAELVVGDLVLLGPGDRVSAGSGRRRRMPGRMRGAVGPNVPRRPGPSSLGSAGWAPHARRRR